MMEICNYPNCCGAEILTHFPYQNKDGVKVWLKGAIKDYKEDVAFLTAILNNWQNKELEEAFISTGFKKVSIGYNHNHPDTQPLHMYVYNYDYQPD